MQLEQESQISVSEVTELNEIKLALEVTIKAPDIRLESKIIAVIMEYLQEKFESDSYKIKVFVAYENFKVSGLVVAQIDPDYRSYGKPCATTPKSFPELLLTRQAWGGWRIRLLRTCW